MSSILEAFLGEKVNGAMSGFTQAPVPRFSDAVDDMWRRRISCEHEPYNRYTPTLVTTNEIKQIYELKKHIVPGASVLTVLGSGEQYFFSLLYGAKNVLSFDISYHSYLLTSLKMAAIQTFNKTTEYKKFLECLYCIPQENLLDDKRISRVLRNLGKVEKDYVSEAVNKLYVFWQNESCNLYDITQHDYKRLKKIVRYPLPFIWTDIVDLDAVLGKRSFDIVYYSNILSFLSEENVISVLKDTKMHMKPNGKLFLVMEDYRIRSLVQSVYPLPEWQERLLQDGRFYQMIVQRKQR